MRNKTSAMRSNGLLLIVEVVLFVLLSKGVFAAPCGTLPFDEGFEGRVVDGPLDDGNCGDPTGGFDVSARDYCTSIVRNSYTAREGNNYWELKCDWIGCSDAYDSVRVDAHVEGFWGDSCPDNDCHHLKVNDDTEYWIGFSIYIPSDYASQYKGHSFWDFYSSTTERVFGQFRYGGDTTYYDTDNDIRGHHWYQDGDTIVSFADDWEVYKGTWIDWVVHVVLHDTDDSDARFEIYMNGVSGYARTPGQDNMLTGAEPYMKFMCYNSALDNTPCATWVKDYDSTWSRATYFDAIRIYEGDIDDNNYCTVAPAIWSHTPDITYPANGETGLNSTFTAAYDGYADHRTDTQECFAYNATQVHVDEQGGDWSILVYDSGEVSAETSNEVTGLANDTGYQIRVRHKSARSGSLDAYWSEWSETVNFTTGNEPSSSLNYSVIKTLISSTIDGDLSEYEGLDNITLANPRGTTGTYTLLWDDQALYIAANVSDAELNYDVSQRDGSGIWRDDCIEMMFDTSHDDGTSTGSDDHKVFVNINNVQYDTKFNGSGTSWDMDFMSESATSGTVNTSSDTDTGYTIEIAIPWSEWGLSVPSEGDVFGFELVMNDQNGSGERIATIWANLNDDAGKINSPDNWGDIVFSGPVSIHRADTDPPFGCIEKHELMPFIDLWKYDSTEYPMGEVMEAVVLWKTGTGCS